MSLVLVTGANGFVGRGVVTRLSRDPAFGVRAAVRSDADGLAEGVDLVVVGDLGQNADYSEALVGADVVVHCAARVHVMRDVASDPLAAYRLANVEGTLNLARQAVAAGVSRFIFLSSIKVNGDATWPGKPFEPGDPPAPTDPYGISKLEAEQELAGLARETGLKVVVIRPVLVYGPGVTANLRSMVRWLQSGVPLPLGSVQNRRSFVALDNLVDLIVTCSIHPAAAGQVFLVSDGEDLSTPDLLRRTATAMGLKAHLFPLHVNLLRFGAACAGKAGIARRLCGSLQVDISKTRKILGWTPPVGVDAALHSMAMGIKAK
jgi:UDP-N-acetyl-alpha-D-quinovosamine dehydrogenase